MRPRWNYRVTPSAIDGTVLTAPVLRNCLKSLCSVPIASTEDNAHNPIPEGLGGGYKQRIDCRAGEMDFGTLWVNRTCVRSSII
jgi:hypothetical protein